MNWKIIHIDETDSTNRWLTVNRTEGQAPCVVVADYQTAGRGCGTNKWESERGKNLLYSMMIHPAEIPVNKQFVVSMAVANSIAAVVAKYVTSQAVSVKWPNDIYVGDKKICGILIENRLQGGVIKDSIIGIGLNVNQREFKSDAPNPVSLYQLTGQESDLEELLKAFLDAFDSSYNNKTTRFTYKEMLYRKGKDRLYQDKTSRFTATLTDVLPDGRLLLVDQEGRERLYAFKEVAFVI